MDRQPTVTSPTPRRKPSRPSSLVLTEDAVAVIGDTVPAGTSGTLGKDFVALNKRKASDPGPRTRAMSGASVGGAAGVGMHQSLRRERMGTSVSSVLSLHRKSPNRSHTGSGYGCGMPVHDAKDGKGARVARPAKGAGSGAGKNRKAAVAHGTRSRMCASNTIPPTAGTGTPTRAPAMAAAAPTAVPCAVVPSDVQCVPTTAIGGASEHAAIADITLAAAAACAAADAIKEIVLHRHNSAGGAADDAAAGGRSGEGSAGGMASTSSPGSPKRQLPKAPLGGPYSRRSSAGSEHAVALPALLPRDDTAYNADGGVPTVSEVEQHPRTTGKQRMGVPRRAKRGSGNTGNGGRGTSSPRPRAGVVHAMDGDGRSSAKTPDEVAAAAKAMRRDFRTWLAWRKADEAHAGAEAERRRNPTVDSDPAIFRATRVGGVAARAQQGGRGNACHVLQVAAWC